VNKDLPPVYSFSFPYDDTAVTETILEGKLLSLDGNQRDWMFRGVHTGQPRITAGLACLTLCYSSGLTPNLNVQGKHASHETYHPIITSQER
jgi:hypothetical protein